MSVFVQYVYMLHRQDMYSHFTHPSFFLLRFIDSCPSNLPLSDDYNRVLLKLDEAHSHDSVPDEDDEEEEDSSDEEDEESTKYINATYIDVCYFSV